MDTGPSRHLLPIAIKGRPLTNLIGRFVIVAIGIDQYLHHQILRNAVKDAMGVVEFLTEKLGFVAPCRLCWTSRRRRQISRKEFKTTFVLN
jgi:hypothetical protein